MLRPRMAKVVWPHPTLGILFISFDFQLAVLITLLYLNRYILVVCCSHFFWKPYCRFSRSLSSVYSLLSSKWGLSGSPLGGLLFIRPEILFSTPLLAPWLRDPEERDSGLWPNTWRKKAGSIGKHPTTSPIVCSATLQVVSFRQTWQCFKIPTSAVTDLWLQLSDWGL